MNKFKYNINNKKGISLLVLIITILVIIILAGAIFFGVNKMYVNKKADEAVFKNDVSNFVEELKTYHYFNLMEKSGKYSSKSLFANKEMIEYEENIDLSNNMLEVIKIMKNKPEYSEMFEIFEGELVYIGKDREKKEWAEEIGIKSKYAEPKIEITSPSPEEVKAGTNVSYEITVSSNFKLEYVNFEGNINLIKRVGENTSLVKTIENSNIEEIQNSEQVKKIKVNIDTTGLENGEYLLEVKEKIAKDEMGMENETKKESKMFSVRTVIYENIQINLSKTVPTNENIELEIVYPEGITKKEYKLSATDSFIPYTGKILVDKNLTVYVKGEDSLGNRTETATKTIDYIDKILPSITLAEASKTTSSVIIKATASDTGSGINSSSYEYSKDDGIIWVSGGANTTYTFSGLTSGSYKFKARVKDNASNTGTSTTLTVATTGVDTLEESIEITANTTTWTNQNVTVTINYSTDITTKEYKIGAGGTWTTYIGAISITSNNTVYARGKDAAGNTTTGGVSLTINNIDKIPPVLTIPDNISILSTEVNGFDLLNEVKVTDNSNEDVSIDIEGKLEVSSKDYEIIYVATDKAGNITKKSRIIKVKNVNPPVITILGSNPASVDLGDIYNDPGVTAYDTIDGDVSSSITITNNLNTSIKGEYTVVYTAIDKDGNKATASRVVRVYETLYRSRIISNATYEANYNASVEYSYSCPSGYSSSGYGSSMTCTRNVTQTISPNSTVSYSCASGYTLNGTTCSKTTTTSATESYSCPSGYDQSGRTCIKTTSSAATTNYSCPSGYTKSGSTCIKQSTYTATSTSTCPSGYTKSGSSCTKKSTYNAVYEQYCPSGWSGPSGGSCGKIVNGKGETITAPSKLVCNSGGTLSGSTCTVTSTANPTTSYSCPNGGSVQGGICLVTETQSASVSYSCPNGGSVQGGICLVTETQSASVSYSCPSGSSVSGSSCISTQTTSATTSYSCPYGYSRNGTTCSITNTASANTTTSYSCPSGYTGSGSGSNMSCYKDVTSTTNPNSTTSYYCPNGGTKSGSTCIRGYYTCSSGSLNGSLCYGTWSSWTKTIENPSSTLEVEIDRSYK